ncbi:MAG: transcriptional regulator [Planctomycetota bacterium]
MPAAQPAHAESNTGGSDVPREVIDLAREIAKLPDEYQATLEPAFVRVVDSVRRRRRILQLVQDALAQLRLDVKYLMFDLDATKAERDELKAELGRD